MAYKKFLGSFDCLHRPRSEIQKRELYGKAFGVELPAWIIFHAMLGYVLLGVGVAAMVLRLPTSFIRRWRWLHPYVGYVWVFGTVWMPVTAIWCAYSFVGWDVVAFFIFSMYAAIQFGWLSVKVYLRSVSKMNDEIGRILNGKVPWKVKVWKYFHAVFMVYSFCMLLGAGISFPFRSENSAYPNH